LIQFGAQHRDILGRDPPPKIVDGERFADPDDHGWLLAIRGHVAAVGGPDLPLVVEWVVLEE
jgi:hypothetical protein